MKGTGAIRGFTLVELLIAAAVFTFVMTAVSGLFVAALDMQRRGIGIQKVEENAQFVMEAVAREVRVSIVTSGNADCEPGASIQPRGLTIDHPDRGTISYSWKPDPAVGVNRIYRSEGGRESPMTADDVDIVSLAFCVTYAGLNDGPTRVTVPMVIRSTGGRERTRVEASLQTTVVSRNLAADLVAP